MVWRYILAFVLSIAVIVVWQSLFQPPRRITPEPAAAPPQAEAPAQVEPKRREPKPPTAETEAPPAVEEPSSRRQRERKKETLTVERAQLYATGAPMGEKADKPRFRIVADSMGAILADVALPEFGGRDDRDKPYELLEVEESTDQKSGGLLRLEIPDHEIPRGENWDLETFVDERGAPGVRFTNEIDGLAITKTVACPGKEIPGESGRETKLPPTGLYHLLATLEFKNESNEPMEFSYRLFGPLGIDTAASRGGPGTDIYFVSGEWNPHGKAVAAKLVAGGSVANGDVSSRLAWVGESNNYFVSLLFPYRDEPGPSSQVEGGFARAYPDPGRVQELVDEGKTPDEARDGAYKNVLTGVDSRTVKLAPGESVVHRYGVFMGPRFKDVLATYGPLHFEEVNDYNFLVSFFLALLRFLRGIAFGSWGFAIILMTVLVKICLHPFNKKSQTNMHRFQKKMQKVKPEMDEIKKRYKDNRLKQNQEIQRLFKEKGINPGQQMGGCLLILLQLPIWYALYSTLRYSLGLRQAAFLWMDDLTMPDRLFPLGFHAFGGKFMYFNLLPVLYVIFTIVNQRLQPRPEDPQMRSQYHMMTFMMAFFGFIFYSFPAGFMLYIMTSTLLGIFESKMIKSELAREEAAPAGAAAGGGVQVATAGGPMYGGKGAGSGGGGARSGASGKKRGKGGKRAKGKR